MITYYVLLFVKSFAASIVAALVISFFCCDGIDLIKELIDKIKDK